MIFANFATFASGIMLPEGHQHRMLMDRRLDTVGCCVHNNWIELDSDISSFMEISHVITSGQNFGYASTSGSKMLVRAGRKGSSSVASDFDSGGDMLCSKWGSVTPDKLNFYVVADFTFADSKGNLVTLNNLRIGQGSTASHNNWWIAGSQCTTNLSGNLVCIGEGGKVTFKQRDYDKVYSEIETLSASTRRLASAEAGKEMPAPTEEPKLQSRTPLISLQPRSLAL